MTASVIFQYGFGRVTRLLLLIAVLIGLGEGENLHYYNRQQASAADRTNYAYPRYKSQDASASGESKPYFRSHGQTYKIKVGDPVTMTCVVENLGNSVIVWKQTNRIISAGERLIRKDARMKLIPQQNGVSLRISAVTPEDRGDYICELETYGEPIDQTNKLDVLVPPRVTLLNPASKLSVRKSSTVKLACNATGFPRPRIVWQREYQMLPTGEKQREGNTLVLGNVTRLDAGSYICSAANGVDRAVEAKVELTVIYEPEIIVDKAWVHADMDVEVKISCVVYAQPEAEVRWYRDTMLLAQNENRMMKAYGVRHSLLIHRASRQDFGNYSCAAENKLGRSRAFIEVSGQPNQANISSRPMSYYSDRYNLTWTVFSYSKVTQYRILYRKVIPETLPNFDTRSRWHNVIPPTKPVMGEGYESEPLQDGSYMFYALEPQSQYEVVVAARNRWGWSRNSEPFFFSTRTTDFSPKVDASQPKSPSDVVDYATDDFTHQDLSAVNSKSKSPSTSTAFMPSSGSRTSSSSAFFFFFSVLLYPLSGLFSTHSMR